MSMEKVVKSDEQWKRELTADQYRILRLKGTELPFHNEYYANKRQGSYLCAGCGNKLFSSKAKYDSGTGWPSFVEPISPDAVEFQDDKTFRTVRTEVVCARCGGHLGHVFDDGPLPTGKRYCMNSGSLRFVEES
ncbi:MAG: peptide-methionine (R)-S-oxide reductase MsrB [Methanomassiliicoccales archaeon]|jgi:peptide-methionine (R)-S-oxide reductase|nr:peptide-methionine (R)-S-oxide reductase MsrB [Methanomassiliicoccales archaeon]